VDLTSQNIRAYLVDMFLLQTPARMENDSYWLRINGFANSGLSHRIFTNRTSLDFDKKQVSVFIQTDRVLYKQGQVGKLLKV